MKLLRMPAIELAKALLPEKLKTFFEKLFELAKISELVIFFQNSLQVVPFDADAGGEEHAAAAADMPHDTAI